MIYDIEAQGPVVLLHGLKHVANPGEELDELHVLIRNECILA